MAEILLASTNESDDFDVVAVAQPKLFDLSARHDFEIHFDGAPLRGNFQVTQQLADGCSLAHLMCFAVEYDLHAAVAIRFGYSAHSGTKVLAAPVRIGTIG